MSLPRSLSRGVLVTLSLALAACSASRPPEPPAPQPPPIKISAAAVRVPVRSELPGLIGRVQTHRIRPNETLLDVARDAGLGFQEVKDANPTVDEWIPPVDLEVTVPTQWIVPRSRYRGLVVNVPEMRIYYFPARTKPGHEVSLRTWPIGIGRDEAQSPVGTFTVRAKDRNPTWHVPDSIYRTMDPPKRRVVPPGPDNPLGEYRIRLSSGLYQIHGTNTPWSIGRETTHGCIRLYPEDIGEVFDLVQRGTPGEFVYQPIKLGEEAGRIYVEVHEDVYSRLGNLERAAQRLVREAKLTARVDPERLRAAVRARRGVPVDVTRDAQRTARARSTGGAND